MYTGANAALTVTYVIVSGKLYCICCSLGPRDYKAGRMYGASGVYGSVFGHGVTRRLGCEPGQHHNAPRGLAMGASSHGVGTASLIQKGEQEAAALSSVGMILTGVCHTLLCATPAVRSLVHALAR